MTVILQSYSRAIVSHLKNNAMPGYETERFTNLSPTERAELTCSICQDVFRCPVVANCCLQTFCEDCISDWLDTNSTCPYDRATLTRGQLSRPPRAMMNMLGKLKIKCDFREKGCKEVLLLENLNTHLLSCKHNADNKKCKKCFTESAKSGHDCVKSLLEANKKLSADLDKLKKDYETVLKKMETNSSAPQRPREVPNDSLLRELQELKREKENFLKTIQEISNKESAKSATVQPSNSLLYKTDGNRTTFTASSSISEQDIFSEARKHLLTPNIVQNETKNEIKTRIIAMVREEVREFNSMFIVCKNIVEKLNQEFGHRWHCVVSYDQHAKAFFSYENGFLIKLQFGKLLIEIYKTQFLNLNSMRQRFRSGKIKREISILRSDMRETMIADIRRLTFAAFEKCETLTDISSDIKTQMEATHGGQWQCFIFAHFGNFGLHHAVGKFISYEIGELSITVFQTTN